MGLTNIFTIACEKVIIDSHSSMPSIINCIAATAPKKFPNDLPSFSMITLWQSSEEIEVTAYFYLVDPSGEKNELAKFDGEISKRTVLTAYFPEGVAVKGPGEHYFQVMLEIKEQKKARSVTTKKEKKVIEGVKYFISINKKKKLRKKQSVS